MNSERLAIRYAKSLYILSKSENNIEVVLKDGKNILMLIKESKEFKMFLSSPILKSKIKIKILKETLKSKISDFTLNNIIVITKNSREKYLGQIIKHFISLYKKEQEILSVSVKSPFQVSEEQKDLIVKYLGYSKNDKIDFQIKIDKNLIGGLIIDTEGRQLDMSIISKLRQLKTKFSKNLYIKQY